MKRSMLKLALIQACLVALGSLATSCKKKGEEKPAPTSDETPEYTLDEYEFSPVFTSLEGHDLLPYDPDHPKQHVVSYDVYRNIGGKNYLRLVLETDVNLVGHIRYMNADNSSETNSEKFYVTAGSTEFKTFLDAYRHGARGAFNKIITKIDFENVEEKDGHVNLYEVGVSDRSQNIYKDMLITDDTLVFGTSMTHGGCIKIIKRIDQDIYEYMDADGNICIDRDVDPDYVKVVSDDVNFVNIYDLGREIQPSYYLNAKEANGYFPETECIYHGLGDTLYNPIQCGSCGNKNPQIIDYVYKPDHIYIKTKAQDWFFDNDQANGYIETWYSFGGDGMLLVDNSYTDFSQFIDCEENPLMMSNQETPATYFVHPLNYFYCETRQGVIFDPEVGEMNGRTKGKTSKNDRVDGDYVYTLKGMNVTGKWCAYVNENKFGAGIYMPNADIYYASRGRHSSNYYAEECNRKYSPENFQFDDATITPSYAALNYNYIDPAVQRKMVDFIPMLYSYAIYIGDTEEMAEAFADLNATGRITNQCLIDGSGWPKK